MPKKGVSSSTALRCFHARLYGQHRARRKTERVVDILKQEGGDAVG